MDVLNAFQASQDFATCITQNGALMNKLEFVQSAITKSKQSQSNISSLLYKVESSTFECGLSVLFECKNAFISYQEKMSKNVNITIDTKLIDEDILDDDDDDDAFDRELGFECDEVVKSQILPPMTPSMLSNQSSTPPPVNTLKLKPVEFNPMIQQKSAPENDV